MTPAKPSLDLLRSLTDEHVLRALMDERRLTRAELATRTGLSKPTVSESVRRLTEAGLLHDTGERTTGRGRSGSYYALAGDVGCALVVGIAPEGVVSETVDPHGDVVARFEQAVRHPARPEDVTEALSRAAGRATAAAGAPVRLAVVSAADPVDRTTGRLLHLPDAPFLLGELAPGATLARLVRGPVLVDNDVNWAARAEREVGDAAPFQDFAYVHLGEGLGCAVVSDGEVRRGHSGIAGEIAHVVTTGANGQAVPFTEVFAQLGLRRAGSTAIDVDALCQAVTGPAPRAGAVLDALATAVGGVVAAAVALCDPELVVVGGRWGREPVVLEAIQTGVRRLPRYVPVQAARVTHEPSLAGARSRALRDLRSALVPRVGERTGTG